MTPAVIAVAWILWGSGYNEKAGGASTIPVGAYDTRQECEQKERARSDVRDDDGRRRDGKDPSMSIFWTCYPETFDPRPCGERQAR